MKRRQFIVRTASVLAPLAPLPFVGGCAPMSPATSDRTSPLAARPPCAEVARIDAQRDRIQGIYACTRPFRHAGPRVEVEPLGTKLIVHNYGHGGTGWSLSWGSSAQALALARTAAAGRGTLRSLAVVGCGPLGLTSALLAQEAGLSVRIYAKAIPPHVSSMGATGLWSPDSRFCDAPHQAGWVPRWNDMARTSFERYQQIARQPGRLVEWFHGYLLSDTPFDEAKRPAALHLGQDEKEPEYAQFKHAFRRPMVDLSSDENPFPKPHARYWNSLMFNITDYAGRLMSDFLANGGEIVMREFSDPRDFLSLPEDTVINATGYGAKALFNDGAVVPVRGQTVRLNPQSSIHYGLRADQFLVMPRTDGLVVQNMDETGNYDNSNDTRDRADAEAVVAKLQSFVAGMKCGRGARA